MPSFQDSLVNPLCMSGSASPLIGVVGGGQLALMLVQAAGRRGVDVVVQTGSQNDPAAIEASRIVATHPVEVDGTRQLVQGCDGVTFENEWVNIEELMPLEQEGVPFRPSLRALAPLVDKISQRKLLGEIGFPCPEWALLSSICSDQPKLPSGWNFPVMAKSSRWGYDGKGTKVLSNTKELTQLLQSVDSANWLLEVLVPFEKELAIVASRDLKGRVRCLPLAETHQFQQVCDWVIAPASVEHAVEAMAYNMAASLLMKLNYVGVLAIEFFYGPDGLQVNEIAPRTHNSAHFSIEACNSSQFDQQLCIAAGLPVPSPELKAPGALMVNLLGLVEGKVASLADRLSSLRSFEHFHVHWYGKGCETPGRKLGHVTVLLNGVDAVSRGKEAASVLDRIRSIWPTQGTNLA
ncbi:MAG: 5-(carboxyamino)imidazole ribonucleotide synthase [Prochlorococcus sp.]|jgi:5-(carboxyamino)imidazole ribonucleotide synthase|nr:5-(carboxyamino)imidazole ribonucleotide synthase [Prochlorococcaceae cyanobacterium Fu_MAG_72]|tara:strand:- start:143 stop:1363 length:1221 start_codon:yes stop_codon:yes gene_type:complete